MGLWSRTVSPCDTLRFIRLSKGFGVMLRRNSETRDSLLQPPVPPQLGKGPRRTANRGKVLCRVWPA